MVYIREGKPLERLDKLLDFKFKADLEYNKGVYHV